MSGCAMSNNQHRKQNFDAKQAERVALAIARVEAGLSPTTGEPMPPEAIEEMRRMQAQRPAMMAAQRKRFRRVDV